MEIPPFFFLSSSHWLLKPFQYYWNVCSFYYHTPYFSQWRPHSWYGRKNSWCLKKRTSSQIELRIVQWNDGEHQKLTMAIKSWCSQPFFPLFSIEKIFLVDIFDRRKTTDCYFTFVDLWWTYVLSMQHSWTKCYK